MAKKLAYSLILIAGLVFGGSLHAQNAEDALRYSLEYPTYDPVSMVLPGVTQNSGFGSFQENPAVMALFDRSFGSFSLSVRNVSEESNFIGSVNQFDDTQTSIGDIGVLFKAPTTRGSLVLGAGYSQSTDYNRALGLDLRNNQSSITDFYNITADDQLYNAAFDVYAVDYADVDSTFTESIFRIGFPPGQFPGINQDMELTERGELGDFSAFIATEFQKNLYVGASIGVLTGGYSYERQFLESDLENFYDGNFIDSDGDGAGETDIQSILSIDRIDAEFYGLSARIGALYEINPHLRIGGSYQIQSKLTVEEEFSTQLSSTFDNGSGFEATVPGEFTYKISRPDRLNLGLSIVDVAGVTISGAAERVDYGDAEFDFDGVDIEFQNTENLFIESEFREVWNLRGGIEFTIAEVFKPRAGYGYYPSPRSNFDSDRQFFNAGFSAQLSESVWLDIGAQYSIWDDQNSLYTFDDGTQLVDAAVTEEVRRLNIMGGIRLGF